MRIGIIAAANHPIRQPYPGGLERHTAMLGRGLVARGHAVTVFAGSGSQPDGYRVETIGPDGGLQLSQDARKDASMVAERFLQEHHAYQTLLLDLRQRADLDVIHNNSLHHLPVAMCAAVPRPMSMTLHTPPTPWLESAFQTAELTPTTVAVSQDTARRWAHVTTSEVLHNAVDLDRWATGPGDSGRAVWTGRLVPEKGPHLALQAAQRAGLPLDLAGPITDVEYVRTELEPRMSAQDALVGHLDSDELAELVGRAVVQLVTPRWEEPYGLVAAEALACGTPVAAFDRGAMAELLDRSSGRLAPADDVDGLATAALEAAALERRDCRARAEAVAGLTQMVDGYEQLFEEVAA